MYVLLFKADSHVDLAVKLELDLFLLGFEHEQYSQNSNQRKNNTQYDPGGALDNNKTQNPDDNKRNKNDRQAERSEGPAGNSEILPDLLLG